MKDMRKAINRICKTQQSRFTYILFLPVLVLVLLLTPLVVSANTTNYSDSVDDVWTFQGDVTTLNTDLVGYSWNRDDWTQGDFADTIDIVSATVEGQSVTIECQGEIPVSTLFGNFTRPASFTTPTTPMTPTTPISNFTFPAQMSLDISIYAVYFDDDNDPTDWEAAITYTAGGGRGGGGTYYYVGDLTTILIPMGRLGGDTTGWILDSAGNHHSIRENELAFSFPEYANIDTVKTMGVTIQMQMAMGFPPQIEGWYWDWVPDEFEFWEPETTPDVPEIWLGWTLTATLLLVISIGVLLKIKKR